MLMRLSALVALILCVTGCGGDRLPEALEERAQLRWDSVLAKEAPTAYQLMSPGFRAAVSEKDYTIGLYTGGNLTRTAARVVGTEDCTAESCVVLVDVDYTVIVSGVGPHIGTSRTEETWLTVEGAWYYVPPDLR